MEHNFEILRYVNKVPSLASCTKCQRKFFTPGSTFRGDPEGAHEYLQEKFAQHQCPGTQGVLMANESGQLRGM